MGMAAGKNMLSIRSWPAKERSDMTFNGDLVLSRLFTTNQHLFEVIFFKYATTSHPSRTECTNVNILLCLVLFRPGLAWKPRLWPGLRLSQTTPSKFT